MDVEDTLQLRANGWYFHGASDLGHVRVWVFESLAGVWLREWCVTPPSGELPPPTESPFNPPNSANIPSDNSQNQSPGDRPLDESPGGPPPGPPGAPGACPCEGSAWITASWYTLSAGQ